MPSLFLFNTARLMENGNISRASNRRIDWLCLLFLLAVNTFYYRRILFLGEIPGGNDLQYQYFAWKNFFISSLKEGVFPFWNPYAFAGSPVIHEILAACFYPFDYLFLILPIPWGFGLSYWFHLTLGGALFYWLSGEFLRTKSARLLAATAYMLSAPVLTRMGEGVPTLNQTYALTPLFFMVGKCLYKYPSLRLLGCFAWVCALFVYAGHPQIPFMAVQLLAVYLAYRTFFDFREGRPAGEFVRAFLFLSLGGLLGLAIAAPQAFPFLEYASYSATRSGGARYAFAAEGSLPPVHLITSVIPFLFGDPSTQSYWKSLIPYHETCGYLGAFSFFLVISWLVLSKRKGGWIWFAILVATVFLAMGSYTPVHRFFYEAVPGWDRFRQPARSFFILAFAGSLLAGFGLQRIERLTAEENQRGARGPLILMGLILLLAITALLYIATHKQELLQSFAEEMNQGWRAGTGEDRDPYEPENFLHRFRNLLSSISLFAVWTLAFIGWFYALIRFPEHRKPILWAAPVILAIDLLWFGGRFLVTHDKEGWKEKYYPDSELMAMMRERTEDGRLIIPDNALHWVMREREPELYPNGPLYYRVRVVRGYNPTILRHYSEFINLILGREPETFPGGLLFLNDIPNADPMGLRVLGVKHLVEWKSVDGPFVPEKKFPNGLLLYRFDAGLPRAFRAVEFDNKWGLKPLPREEDRTIVLESNCNRLLIETEAEKESWLVFNDCWFPGWEVTVDGEPAEIATAFHAFQAVRVPEGKSRVEWRFRPTLWNLYLGVALVAAILSTLLVFMKSGNPEKNG